MFNNSGQGYPRGSQFKEPLANRREREKEINEKLERIGESYVDAAIQSVNRKRRAAPNKFLF